LTSRAQIETSNRGEETPRCLLCGGPSRLRARQRPWVYWQCRDCGSAFLWPQPKPEELAAFYESFHLPCDRGGIIEEFEARMQVDFPAKAERVQKGLRSWGPPGSEARDVLDLGCGKGLFVKELMSCGLNAEGIDVSATAVEAGRAAHGAVSLRVGWLGNQSDWVARFDAVTSWATIEHVRDPQGLLRAVKRALKPGGLFFFDTGLVGDFVDRHAPGLVQWFDAPQHLFVFSWRGLERLLADCGFSVLDHDLNYERTRRRRLVKTIRNRSLALAGKLLFRFALGSETFERMKMETKMPFGSLVSVVARARD